VEKRFFSIKEAAEFSGLSSRLLYLKCEKRELRHFRVNRKIVVDREDLIQLITQTEIKPGEELLEEIKERIKK